MDSRLAVAALSSLILYFAFHAFAGDQGLGAWSDLQSDVSELEDQRDRLQAQVSELRGDIARLDPSGPDEELVEVLAREQLGYVKPDELIVLVTVSNGEAG